ncbi:ABC transporter permease [Caproiciproducens galactitolivorans]|uniref:ABC transporter permease n=1 Tax=Caproiciproducens galactitolivorans TaxID=642589 RepID=A0ABT4BZ20_9FIRM|nr:ABC transporter permease [Caproiciproducens galactitolivorans]MCY1715166.1 ABC transporter permease [Caproiciproducens galactitolivorans]
MKNWVHILKEQAIFVVLIVLFIIFACSSPEFLTVTNLLNIARQVSILGIASVGMTYVILIGGIDLSTGSIITFVNIITAYLMVKSGINMWLAILISLIVSTGIGFINGFLVANFNMPSLIVTFATQIVFEGLAYIISKGMPIFGFPNAFTQIGQGYLGPIPTPIIIMIVIFAIGGFILNKTYFGRYFYALGGNETASELSGIRVKRVKYLIFSLSGFFAGVAGIVMLARTNSGQPTAGKGYEFKVITDVVLGGVSVAGGSGKLSNVVAGVMIMGILENGMVLLNISSYVQMVVEGIILVLAVGFDCVQKKGLLKA